MRGVSSWMPFARYNRFQKEKTPLYFAHIADKLTITTAERAQYGTRTNAGDQGRSAPGKEWWTHHDEERREKPREESSDE